MLYWKLAILWIPSSYCHWGVEEEEDDDDDDDADDVDLFGWLMEGIKNIQKKFEAQYVLNWRK